MSEERDKPLARNVGEFFGHIFRAFKTRPESSKKKTVRKTAEEEDRGDVVLRRTTIEEVEFKKEGDDKTDR